MARIWVNVEGAIYNNGKWLMIQRGDKEPHAAGTISMVGGTLETTQDEENALEKTLIREIREEIGIEIEDEMEYIESKTFTADNNQKTIDIVFLCRYKSGEPKAMTDEVADILWLTKEEILEHPKTPPWIKRSIELANGLVPN